MNSHRMIGIRSSLEIGELREEEIPWVYNSWLKGYRSSHETSGLKNSDYFALQHARISSILKRSRALVARGSEDPSWYCAYLVYELIDDAYLVHWAYTKAGQRNQGIMSSLIMKSILDIPSDERPTRFVYTHARAPFDQVFSKRGYEHVGLPMTSALT